MNCNSVTLKVIEDLNEECCRHTPGSVLKVKVPRPPVHLVDSLFGSGDYGKVCMIDWWLIGG